MIDLRCGDSRKILAEMPEGFADCIVSDVPYKLTSGGYRQKVDGIHTTMSGCFSHENYDNKGSIVKCDITWPEIMALCFRALKPGGHFYCMANDKNQLEMQNTALAAGFRFHNLLTWEKGTVTANRWYMKGIEFTGFFYKGRARAINDCSTPAHLYIPQTDVSDHPTEKPVLLMKTYIRNSTKPGDLVLDPFMGTASVGVAAIESGCRFMGIDIEPKWCDFAEKRITQAISGGIPHNTRKPKRQPELKQTDIFSVDK